MRELPTSRLAVTRVRPRHPWKCLRTAESTVEADCSSEKLDVAVTQVHPLKVLRREKFWTAVHAGTTSVLLGRNFQPDVVLARVQGWPRTVGRPGHGQR